MTLGPRRKIVPLCQSASTAPRSSRISTSNSGSGSPQLTKARERPPSSPSATSRALAFVRQVVAVDVIVWSSRSNSGEKLTASVHSAMP